MPPATPYEVRTNGNVTAGMSRQRRVNRVPKRTGNRATLGSVHHPDAIRSISAKAAHVFFVALRRAFTCLAPVVLAAATTVSTPTVAQAREYAGIVVDARTGRTLYAHDADEYRFPASLTKMMTLYMVFDALEAGRISLGTRVPFSAYAAGRPPSKIGVGAGRSITVEQAIYALVTKSANDVATAVGEKLGGTESNFAKQMTRKARQLGMKRTTFRNASGLPNAEQRTTARDMARLGLALREHHAKYYGYFNTRSWRFGKTRYPNHNRLLGTVRGVDGIKTGYIRASGYNLVSSVQDNGRSIVAVVIGGRTGASRNAQMKKLIAGYLPKASRRGGGAVIARGGDVLDGLTVAGLPRSGPTPRLRPTGYKSVTENVVAYAAPETVDPVTRAVPTVPAGIDPVTTASTKASANAVPSSGWVIQVAATPTAKGASDMHEKAFNAAGSVLSGKRAFTETIVKGGDTMHRVRFGGFGGKSEAWAACKALKRKRFGCYALELG